MCGRICTDQVCSKRVKIEIDMGEAGEYPHESTIKNGQQPTLHSNTHTHTHTQTHKHNITDIHI